METRKKIDFDFITKNFSIIKDNFLIIEINEKKYIGRLSDIDGDLLKLDEVRRFEVSFKESYPHLTFNRLSTDIFLPTPADIGKLGNEILLEYHSIINDKQEKNKELVKKFNDFCNEKEKNKELVKKFNDFCNENNIDEQDIWVYLNEKSEEEGW